MRPLLNASRVDQRVDCPTTLLIQYTRYVLSVNSLTRCDWQDVLFNISCWLHLAGSCRTNSSVSRDSWRLRQLMPVCPP